MVEPAKSDSPALSAGVDVGASSVKVAIMKSSGDEQIELLATSSDRIRRRDPREVIAGQYEQALKTAGVVAADIDYLASTGEGELVEQRRGHFYGMTTHARGGLFLYPKAGAVLDIGALHARAISIDPRGKVLSYRMTSQCASGSGQFLENISRYLGVALEEVGELSLKAQKPEKISGICAVLAETDVINMVSRGIATADILRGIHESMAGRFIKLLRTSKATGTVVVTGGSAMDVGLTAAIRDGLKKTKLDLDVVTDDRSIFAGAIGAAIWGGFRHRRLLSAPRT